jgi:hypothetical protein
LTAYSGIRQNYGDGKWHFLVLAEPWQQGWPAVFAMYRINRHVGFRRASCAGQTVGCGNETHRWHRFPPVVARNAELVDEGGFEPSFPHQRVTVVDAIR